LTRLHEAFGAGAVHATCFGRRSDTRPASSAGAHRPARGALRPVAHAYLSIHFIKAQVLERQRWLLDFGLDMPKPPDKRSASSPATSSRA
jgi:hypothetical protein